MTNAGAYEVHFPALLPREPVRAVRPLGGRTATASSACKDRKGADYLLAPDARGGVHAAREGPVLVVQGPAAVDLPDPGQVPRRGAAARRPPARPRVHDEGRVLVRLHRCGARCLVPGAARRLRAHLRSGSASSTSSSQADAGRDGRVAQRGVPAPDRRSAKTPSCARPAATPPTSRRSRPSRPSRSRSTGCPSRSSSTRRTRRRSRRSSTIANAAPRRAPTAGRVDRGRTRSRTSCSRSPTSTARASSSIVGLPGDRDVDDKRVEVAFAPAEVEAATEADFEKQPAAREGLHRPLVADGRGARRGVGHRHPLPARPARRRRHRVDHRREHRPEARALARRRPRLRRRRLRRGRERARGRPRSRRLGPGRARARHGDRPRVPARPQVRRGARPQGARRERQARHRHDGLVRHRRHPHPRDHRRAQQRRRRASSGPRRSRRSTCTSSRPARMPSVFDVAEQLVGRARGRRPRRALRRPPEGLARRQVRRRRARRRAEDRHRRPRRGRRPGRAVGPPLGRSRNASRSPTRSPGSAAARRSRGSRRHRATCCSGSARSPVSTTAACGCVSS